MNGSWRRISVVLVLFGVLFVASCEHGVVPAPDALTGPAQAAVVEGVDGELYTLVEETLPEDLPLLSVSQVIGLLGGEVHLAGHTLEVPFGAVLEPVLFTLKLRSNGYVEVDLTALTEVLGFLGRVLQVDLHRFRRPVTLELSYARATNVTDPSRLIIVHAPGRWGYENLEPLESQVDTTRKVVRARLDHFTRYCLAVN
ncbi:MAG TPA: hypothetical protein VF212_06335 [Longimicrobiales bacterium]